MKWRKFTRRTRIFFTVLFFAPSTLLLANVAEISPVPKDIRLQSESGEYTVHIKAHVSQEPGCAVATLKKPRDKKFALTYPMANAHIPLDAILFDDGQVLALDDWPRMGVGEVVAMYDSEGNKKWSHKLSDILSEEKIKSLPKEAKSFWWRKSPTEWSYEHQGTPEESIWIILRNEDRLRLRLSDGVSEYQAMDELNEDAIRWVRRAEVIAKQSGPKEQNREQAIVAYNKAIMADIACVEAYLGLGDLYLDHNLYNKAIETLLEGIRQLEGVGVQKNQQAQKIRSSLDVDPITQLYYLLSKAYFQSAQKENALETLDQARQRDPNSWETNKRLARLFIKLGRLEEADQLLKSEFKRMTSGADVSWSSAITLGKAAVDVGEVYEAEKQFERAKSLYLEIIQKELYYEPLYQHLVYVHTQLRDIPSAIDVIDKMIEKTKTDLAGAFQEQKIANFEADKKKLLASKK